MTVQEHLQQARHNEALASQLSTLPLAAYDWAITVLFYSVLHFVDAYLLQRYSIVPQGHVAIRDRRTGQRIPGRNDYVRQHLPQIAPAYQLLYSASRRARYEGAYLGPNSAGYYQNLRSNEFAGARRFFRQVGW
jgi:hypothetical protein